MTMYLTNGLQVEVTQYDPPIVIKGTTVTYTGTGPDGAVGGWDASGNLVVIVSFPTALKLVLP